MNESTGTFGSDASRGRRLFSGGFLFSPRWRARVFRTAPADGTGVVLGHSRIYILPTRRGLALIGTLAIMLVTSMNYALALGFVATFVLSGLVGAALLNTFRNLAGLVIRPASAGETFAGGQLPFTLTLSGGARTRIAVSIVPRDGVPRLVDLEAETITSVTFELEAATRGRVPLGRVTIASDFPLGLWRGWAYAHFPVTGIAYAVPEPAAPPLPMGSPGTNTSAQGRVEDADLAGLREYQRGDPLQRVAWKAVARGAGWYTKAFDGAGGLGPVILDFASLPASLSIEQKLSRLTAWVLACEHAARAYSLLLPTTRIAGGQGRDQRRAVLTALALHDLP
jgi:uncharacterized protein (DUF58 family)